MSVEPGVVDANVLAYAINADAPQHRPSRGLLEAAHDSSAKLYVTSQIVCELYSVITNARRVATPATPAEALHTISDFLELPGLHVLPNPAGTVSALMRLLRRRPVIGAEIFDLHIVATMQANGIQRIYTFNTRDFEAFPELLVVIPA